MLESYLQMFAKLRTDKGRDRYPEITYHRAPHKPFPLLSVMDLIAQGRFCENLIEPPMNSLIPSTLTGPASCVPDRQAGYRKIRGHQIITAGHFYHYQKDKSVMLYPWEKDKCAMSYVRR
jgi:hypothetical protein